MTINDESMTNDECSNDETKSGCGGPPWISKAFVLFIRHSYIRHSNFVIEAFD